MTRSVGEGAAQRSRAEERSAATAADGVATEPVRSRCAALCRTVDERTGERHLLVRRLIHE